MTGGRVARITRGEAEAITQSINPGMRDSGKMAQSLRGEWPQVARILTERYFSIALG
jgi:hypothetical protein